MILTNRIVTSPPFCSICMSPYHTGTFGRTYLFNSSCSSPDFARYQRIRFGYSAQFGHSPRDLRSNLRGRCQCSPSAAQLIQYLVHRLGHLPYAYFPRSKFLWRSSLVAVLVRQCDLACYSDAAGGGGKGRRRCTTKERSSNPTPYILILNPEV